MRRSNTKNKRRLTNHWRGARNPNKFGVDLCSLCSFKFIPYVILKRKRMLHCTVPTFFLLQICKKVKEDGWTVVHHDREAMGPYAFKGNQWVGYDDIGMVRRKAEFVKAAGYGGAMIWALDLDDFNNVCGCEKYPLLKTINRVLRSHPSPDLKCDALTYDNSLGVVGPTLYDLRSQKLQLGQRQQQQQQQHPPLSLGGFPSVRYPFPYSHPMMMMPHTHYQYPQAPFLHHLSPGSSVFGKRK